jgi:hypothetical protein
MFPNGLNVDPESMLRPEQEENIKFIYPKLYETISNGYIFKDVSMDIMQNQSVGLASKLRFIKIRKALKKFL